MVAPYRKNPRFDFPLPQQRMLSQDDLQPETPQGNQVNFVLPVLVIGFAAGFIVAKLFF